MTRPTAQAVERAAREMAKSYGEDPDDYASLLDICGPNNEPLPVWHQYVEQAKSALSADLGDMVLVPVEATPAIIKAYIAADRRRKRYTATAKRDYRAMIEAARTNTESEK